MTTGTEDRTEAGKAAAAQSRAELWRRRLPSIAALCLVFVVAWVLDPPCC
ncbi:hypothetical protein [Streptodolium elevatio]|uniref:ABC transporter permease n=1 Tax=Streptodolium elevatio TaxID=3157996 RepID=A0ABV3DGF7_9ACTN